jgi:hypothetical protein
MNTPRTSEVVASLSVISRNSSRDVTDAMRANECAIPQSDTRHRRALRSACIHLQVRNSLSEDLTRRNEEIIIDWTKLCNLAKIA